MRIRLLAFASAADAVGAREAELELEPGATVATLRAVVSARWPALAPLAARLAVAVEGTVRGDDAALGEGFEVALLPPVSGG